MNLEIRVIKSKAELKQFVKFPFHLYADNPYWIPPLIASEMAWLDANKNPAFQHSKMALFTAWLEGKMVGRVAGIINEMETEQLGKAHARFGWFDFKDDLSVSKALLESVEKWAKAQGCRLLKGPYGFNSLDKNGMLVEGFHEMGGITTLYNHAYYPQHLEILGYQKELEWLELIAHLPNPFPEKFGRSANLIRKRYHLSVTRPKNKKQMLELGEVFFKMLKETYHHLPTYVPISEEQQVFYIKNYIGMLPPRFVCNVLDENGETIGFAVTMPSMAKAMKKANGHLFPFGFLHLLWAQWFNDGADLTLIGVKEEWRKRGVHSIIFQEFGSTFHSLGYDHLNINPMLEDNQNVLSLWKDFDYRIHKKRRTYLKDL